MANNIFEYKGYRASIEFSAEDSTLYGKVLDIDDKILFEIENPNLAFEVFKATIDEYLESRKMTLDDAIKHCLEVAKEQEEKAKHCQRMDYYDEVDDPSDCRQCAKDHMQLAEWLIELQELRKLKEPVCKYPHYDIYRFTTDTDEYYLVFENCNEHSFMGMYASLEDAKRLPEHMETPWDASFKDKFKNVL